MSELRDIGCLKPERAALNRNIVAGDRVLQRLCGLELLQRQFRLLMDRMG